jgi:hypothetical protein
MATVFTNTGRAWIVDRMDGTVTTRMTGIAWGTGAGTAAITDTTLFTEASEARVNATLSQVTTLVVGDTYQAVGTITANGTKSITNAGLFDASSGGVLLIKGDHSSVPVELNDQIQYTFQLQISG